MRSIHIRLLLPVIMIFITMSASAQMNSGVGYMHGTNKKGDTSAKSVYDADKAPKKDGADTTLISRRATPASEARAESRAGGKGNGSEPNPTDTIPQSLGSNEPNGASSSTTEETTNTMVDCVSPMWRYAAFGFGILSLILLLLLLLRNRKDEDNKPKPRV